MIAALKGLKPHFGLMLAGSAAFSMSTLFSAMKPILLTRFVEEAHYPQSLAGLIVAAPFVGGVLSALCMQAILQRLRYRQAALLFGGALVLGELVNSFVFAAPMLVLASQLVCGFSVGALMGFASACIARTGEPDPIFGFVDMTGVLFMSFFVAWIGAAVDAQGLAGGFAARLPSRSRSQHCPSHTDLRKTRAARCRCVRWT